MRAISGLTLGVYGALAWFILGGLIMQIRGVLGEGLDEMMQLMMTSPLPVVIGFIGGWMGGEMEEGNYWKPIYGWTLALLTVLAVIAGFVLPW